VSSRFSLSISLAKSLSSTVALDVVPCRLPMTGPEPSLNRAGLRHHSGYSRGAQSIEVNNMTIQIKIERIAVSYLHRRTARSTRRVFGALDARSFTGCRFWVLKNGTRLVESDRVLKRGRVCYDPEMMTGS
jgi:hypothetical protein